MKKTLVFFIVICLACLVCFGSYYLLFNLNIGSHPINNIESLLITENDLPTGWKLNYVTPITGDFDWGIENRRIVFNYFNEKGFAHQYVYRFKNTFEARYAYIFLSKDLPIIKDNKNNFYNYKSRVANESIFMCDINDVGGEICDFLGRYEDYIIYFSYSADLDVMSPSDLEKILKTIDSSMNLFLGK